MNQRWQTFISDQSGAMAVTVALLMVVLLSVAALAVDFGYMAWVKGELQKAADAGALAGARALVPYTGTPLAPNWAQAQTKATQTVQQNQAAGQSLTNCQVQTGYWSLNDQNYLQSTRHHSHLHRCPGCPGADQQKHRK